MIQLYRIVAIRVAAAVEQVVCRDDFSACFEGVAVEVKSQLLLGLHGRFGGIEKISGVTQHSRSHTLWVEYHDLGRVFIHCAAIVPAEATELHIGFRLKMLAQIGVLGSQQQRVAVLKIRRRRKRHAACEAARLSPNVDYTHMGPERRPEAAGPVLVNFSAQVGKIILPTHRLRHAKGWRIEQIVLDVAGVLGIEVIEGFILSNRAAEAETRLIALKTILHLVAAEVALGVG